MNSGAHALEMETTDRLQQGLSQWNVRGGSEIDIFFIDDDPTNGTAQLAFSGFVTKYSSSISEGEHAVRIVAASRAIDPIQCNHDGPYFWKNVSAESIIGQLLQPYNLSIEIAAPLERIGPEGFRIGVNDTVFSAIKKLAEKNALTLFTRSDGTFVMSQSTGVGSQNIIGRGDYISASVETDLDLSYSQIIVKSQRNAEGADFATNQRAKQVINNTQQLRHRPLVFVSNGTPESQAKLSEFAKRRFTGESVKARCKVKSAFNRDGIIWGIEDRVVLTEELLLSQQELIASEVGFTFSESEGFCTELGLVTPQTYSETNQSGVSVRNAGDAFTDAFRSFT